MKLLEPSKTSFTIAALFGLVILVRFLNEAKRPLLLSALLSIKSNKSSPVIPSGSDAQVLH